MHPANRDAWQSVSRANLEAAIADLIRAYDGDEANVRTIVTVTVNRVIDGSWKI